MKSNHTTYRKPAALVDFVREGDSVGDIILYQPSRALEAVEVRVEGETVWLTGPQIGLLLGRDKSVIFKHLRSIFSGGELDRASVVANIATTAADGKTYQVEYYNLDAIISVAYRVNSKRGTQFRIWATRTLRDHLLNGFTIHEKRIQERGIADLRESIELLSKTLTSQHLVSDTGREVVELIHAYAKSWLLLKQNDEDAIDAPKSAKKSTKPIDYKSARMAIDRLATALRSRGEAGDVFAVDEVPHFKVSKKTSNRHSAARNFIGPRNPMPRTYFTL